MTRPTAQAVPPPPPAEITFSGHQSVNPLGQAGFRALCSQLPAVLRRICVMAWRIDRRAVVLLLVCQLVTGVSAAALLTATARAMGPLLGSGAVGDRLRDALPALAVVAAASGVARASVALATYAERRITPRLTTETDCALVEAVCRVEAAAHAVDGFAGRQEAAEMGVMRTHVMVMDAQRFMATLVRMVTACGVLSVLNPLMLPLLLLAVAPAGAGAVLTARVDYEIPYANIADRTVRGMTRWWATTPKYADEVRANGMTDYILYWYRALSERVDRRSLAAAPRTLRIALLSSLAGGAFLVLTWVALAWLTASGRIAPSVAATAVIAVQTTMTIADDVVEQAEQCLRNVGAAPAEAGCTFADVVRVRHLLPDRADFEPCRAVLRRCFGEVRPAATMMVCGLADPPDEDRGGGGLPAPVHRRRARPRRQPSVGVSSTKSALNGSRHRAIRPTPSASTGPICTVPPLPFTWATAASQSGTAKTGCQ